MTLLADLDAFLQEHPPLRRPGQRGRERSGLDDLHVWRGHQPLGRRRLTRAARLLVPGAALVRVAAFG